MRSTQRFLTFCAVVLFGVSAHKSSDAAPPLPVAQSNKLGMDETATPAQTIAGLQNQSISALDLGLLRLRTELAPDLEKHLRAQGLLRRTVATSNADVMNAGYVLIGLAHEKVEPYGILIEISVYTGSFGGALASPQAISSAQQLGSRVVSFVRAYAGGPCISSDDPNTKNATSCQGAFYFYDWFVPPSINGFNEPIVGRDRAGYNVYSRVQVKTFAQLKGTRTVVFVNCVGPLIREEVKCDTSGD